MWSTKRLIIVSIALIVAALHFVIGENYREPFPLFVNGYLIGILHSSPPSLSPTFRRFACEPLS